MVRRREMFFSMQWLLLTIFVIGPATCQQNDSATPTESSQLPAVSFLTRIRPMRLPNSSFPLEYHLHIMTNIHLGDLNFKGNVSIDVDIKESTDEIILHAAKLKNFVITATELNTDTVLSDLTYTYDNKKHFLIIHALEYYQVFEAGQRYRLEILYDGVMNEMTTGLYWLVYRDATNQIR